MGPKVFVTISRLRPVLATIALFHADPGGTHVSANEKLEIDSMLSICYTAIMQPTEIPNDPMSQFALSIFRLNGLLMRNGDQVTQSIGQSSARWQVLGRAGYMPQTVAQMAREMGHARQSVQRVAGVLVKEGLLIYRENPANRRSPLLELTPQGAEVLATIYALNEELTQRMMSKLNPKQLVEIADALEEIGNILEADEQQAIEQVSTNKPQQIRKHK